MGKKHSYKKILLTALIFLLCAVFFTLWMYLRKKESSSFTAVITYQGKEIRTVDLKSVKETETFTLGEPGEQNTIQISPEGIGVIKADCRDQICVNQGIRSHGPEPIVCLPHKLSIRFISSPGASSDTDVSLDAVTGR